MTASGFVKCWVFYLLRFERVIKYDEVYTHVSKYIHILMYLYKISVKLVCDD
jgi:hypothetical protein